MDKDSAFSERDSQMRRLDLKDKTLESEGVVLSDGALFFDGENQIKIDMRLERDKSRAGLFGFDGEALIELTDEGLLQEKIGSLQGLDAVQTEFIGEPALKSFVDAFAPSARLRRISRDGTDS